jgi:DNA primase
MAKNNFMDIQEIKSRLTLANLIQYYGYKATKNNRICCPFHEDKTPSMQLYWKTQTAYCFSSNCKTHGKAIDVIDFIMYQENINKHEAIKKAIEILGGNDASQIVTSNPTPPTKPMIGRETFLANMFTYFRNAVHNSPPAKEYLQSRTLDFKQIEVGYNAGQFHHGARKTEEIINQSLEVGLLIDKNLVARTGEKAYQPFGKWCIVFALRNKQNQITGLYFRSTLDDKQSKHYYLKERAGLYPHYPNSRAKKLILCEAIIDGATLLQVPEITAEYESDKGASPTQLRKNKNECWQILALYGTNGLTEEHQTAIKELLELEEIILFFDGDNAGKEAINKYGKLLQELKPQTKISIIETPDGEDVNSLTQGHEAEILLHLINERKAFTELKISEVKEIDFSFSNEKSVRTESVKTDGNPSQKAEVKTESKSHHLNTDVSTRLNTSNPNNIFFSGMGANYTVKGGLKPQLDSLKIALQIINKETRQDYRTKIDLYDYKQIQSTADTVSDLIQVRKDSIEKDLQLLAHLLENFRESDLQNQPLHSSKRTIIKVSESTASKCIGFMKQKNLLQNYNTLIGKSGVVGEEKSRLLLFVIASSYKMKETLHSIVQGTSGSGKTTQIKVTANLMPPEDVKRFTRVTESSFYNYGEYELMNMLIVIEDADGLEEKALLAFRELQSNDILISSSTQKQDNGKFESGEKIVRGPIASLSATTKGEYYEDNLGRCFVITIDESKEQTQKVINYQNQKASGKIDSKTEKETTEFIQNCMRLLKPYEVINPFAELIQLPNEVHQRRRLNQLFQSIIKQITILKQYQRKADNQGKLIAEKEDIKDAIDILFESILLKMDELDGSVRQFFEWIKIMVEAKNNREYEFTRFEAMQATGLKKTQLQHNLNKLVQLEYLKQYGFMNKGFKYKISYWDNMAQVRAKLKDDLQNQLEKI